MFEILYNQNPLMALAIEGDLAWFFIVIAIISGLWIYLKSGNRP